MISAQIVGTRCTTSPQSIDEPSMRIPTELVPRCPVCGGNMVPNLRSDETFVEDEGWHAASQRYTDFVTRHQKGGIVETHGRTSLLFLDLGSGGNTPIIFKIPFIKMTMQNPNATYATVNLGEAFTVEQIADRSIVIDADIADVIDRLLTL